jgi:hypothetical protein
LNFLSRRKSDFVIDGVQFALRFAASWISLPGTVATTLPPTTPLADDEIELSRLEGSKQIELVCMNLPVTVRKPELAFDSDAS